MKNRITIKSDGVNAYAVIKVNASKIGIRILSFFILIEIVLIFWLFTSISREEIFEMIIPILIILVLFIGLPIKYLIWNKYGSEKIIVNTKSVSWSYDYGFIKTNLRTITFDRLGTGYEKVKETKNGEIGRLLFYNYRSHDNLPEIIHQTTVLLTKDEINEFDNRIWNLFENEFNNKHGFIPFSIN